MQLDIACKQLIVHGSKDDIVPASMSREYAISKRKKGEDVTLLELPDSGHFDVVDPQSSVWARVRDAVVGTLL
jgi:pimeloyl-ACP methyl ester carboxylesterase